MGIVSPAPAILLKACSWAPGLVSWVLKGVKVKAGLGVIPVPIGTGLTELVVTTAVAEKKEKNYEIQSHFFMEPTHLAS